MLQRRHELSNGVGLIACACLLASIGVAEPAAAQAIEVDPFTRGYDFAPHRPYADTFFPGERSGFAISGGLGNQYASVGLAQLAYYFVLRGGQLAITPYAGVGTPGLRAFGVSAGVMFMYGPMSRWVLDLGFGPAAVQRFQLFGEVGGERVLNGFHLQLGREFMARPGFFFRALTGVAVLADPYTSRHLMWALSLGGGWKP